MFPFTSEFLQEDLEPLGSERGPGAEPKKKGREQNAPCAENRTNRKKQTCFLRERGHSSLAKARLIPKVGLLELVNCGREICGGKLMEDKDYFSKGLPCRFNLMQSLS